MKRGASLSLLVLAAVLPASALENGEMFVTVNPAAAISFFPGRSGTTVGFFTSAILPVLANLESGAALGVGYCKDSRFAEGRLSIGSSNDYLLVLQGQVGYFWLLGELLGWQKKGLYAGVSVRYMDILNMNTHVHNQNLFPLASAGYWLDFGGFFVDFRLSQMFLIFSWSSMAHSVPALAMTFSPLTAISPYMPLLLISAGWRF